MKFGESEVYSNPLTPTEYERCASTLQHLATRTVPSNSEQNIESSWNINDYLDVSLSMLADSTSLGPNSLEIRHLGWDYSNGPGPGSEGDWDACQTLQKSDNNHGNPIGQALYKFQQDIFSSINPGMPQNYSATRFCTVGAIPPWQVISDNPNLQWNAPFAGICVPGICTARALYYLFDTDPTFSDNLQRLTFENLDENQLDSSFTRFRYVSSLKKSFDTAKLFQTGILCQGETGSAILDHGYRDYGYHGTIVLIVLLCTWVVIGTITATINRFANDEKKQINEKIQFSGNENESCKFVQGYGATSGLHVDGKHQIFRPTSTCDLLETVSTSTSSTASSTNDIMTTNATIEVDSGRVDYYQGSFFYFVSRLDSIFGHYFDASANFREITNMKQNGTKLDENNSNQSKEAERRYEFVHDFNTCNGSTKSIALSEQNHNSRTESDRYHNAYDIYPYKHYHKHPRRLSISSSRCINGFRSISMLWIILAHTFASQASIGFTNPSDFFPPNGVIATNFGSFILSARYAVDTFFFISGYFAMSGLLQRLDPELEKLEDEIGRNINDRLPATIEWWQLFLTRLGILNPNHKVIGDYGQKFLCRNISRYHSSSVDRPSSNKKIRWILYFVSHRVFRILPTYGLILLLWWKVAITLGDGPFWPRWALYAEQCDRYAWTNMLFVNNLIPWHQPYGEMGECMYHTWYLGVDFQLYIILTPIFVMLYIKLSRKLTILLEVSLLTGIIVASLIGTFLHNWSPNMTDGADSAAFDRDFYINPIYRAPPYIIGFITAQVWHEKNRLWPNFGLTNKASFVLSFASVGLMICLPFWAVRGNNKRPCLTFESPSINPECGSGLPRIDLAIYIAFIRPLWSLGLAMLSMLNFNGQCKCFGTSSLLNWIGWDPIARLSFSMYLLHPLVGNLILLRRTTKIRYSHVDLMVSFAGISIITFWLALAIGLIVEWPIKKIARDLEKKARPSSSTS